MHVTFHIVVNSQKKFLLKRKIYNLNLKHNKYTSGSSQKEEKWKRKKENSIFDSHETNVIRYMYLTTEFQNRTHTKLLPHINW